jgi:hypothetical protein
MHGEEFVAALADSRGREITARRPCSLNFGNPVADFSGLDFREPGVAEVMLVFCADCGGIVMHRRMNVLFAYEKNSEAMLIYGFPTCGVPFDQRLRPRGEA